MPEKPSNLVYGVDDRPPIWASLVLAFQHLCIISIGLLFPVIIVRETGGGAQAAASLVSMSMLAGGIGVVIQSFSKGPVGSGYLCPQVCGPSFISASLLAAKTGGLSLLFGMTAFAGAAESLLSRIMHRLRFLFPAEVTGLIVAMVGITVIKVAASNFLGLGGNDVSTSLPEIAVALITLAAMVGLNVWSSGKLRLFCIMLGMIIGYSAAWALGLLGERQFGQIASAPLFAWPFGFHPGWSFDFSLVIPMLVAALCSTLKTVGDLTTCQKINDEEWKRPDMQNIKKGVLADGLGCLSAGLLGGMGQSTSSSNIGLSMATEATSRVIGRFLGGMLAVMAFCPKLGAVFAAMPRPVIGATLIFALSFMIVAGFQIIMSRMLDARKTFVVGLSAIFGLSVDILPHAFLHLHPWVQPIFSSSLSTAAVSAVVLNLLFRMGIARKARLELDPESDSARAVHGFLEHWGRAWGARREVMNLASAAMTEVMETLIRQGMASGPVVLETAFDEFKVRVRISYEGRLMEFPDHAPSQEEVLQGEDGLAKLSGFLAARYVDRVKASESDGRCLISMEFEH